MKRILSSLVLGLVLSFQANAQVELWKEGTHFDVIAETASEKPMMKEYFSFWCPACFQYEPLVAQFKEKLPQDVQFTKVHVNFMGLTSRDIQSEATKAMMIARAMKEEQKYVGAIFNYIHVQRASITGLDDLRKIFVVNGADGEEFDKLAASFSVNSLVNRNNKSIDEFREHLTGVPTFIINEKFKPTFRNDMSVDDMINLVMWLSKQK
ncbi:thiol:disulfide interchange protein DsbA [Glaciecola punicea ACAM 611]|jgi:thiol:disulfide interchange protein DsbA|uniref:Thiol:disulfide interchange protein n=1 Tax=Glaciecola punicea ACAM 611 TaxID=1121923 RepID=H5TEE9_9ALTE|nr:thiol:disulfide interchange protein DsbA/DsbL [Glaciecola punicea]OFA32343.1 disulfide bond formation protein DsbA [Glaciecola punicea]GAB56676.1 thiol:disulfide interchange protein DsbA [Glaciecola punicea ACAM 611]